jgi:hypothetical protein
LLLPEQFSCHFAENTPANFADYFANWRMVKTGFEEDGKAAFAKLRSIEERTMQFGL